MAANSSLRQPTNLRDRRFSRCIDDITPYAIVRDLSGTYTILRFVPLGRYCGLPQACPQLMAIFARLRMANASYRSGWVMEPSKSRIV